MTESEQNALTDQYVGLVVGIQGIHERLRQLAGEISYDAAPGRGTKATVTIKLPEEDS